MNSAWTYKGELNRWRTYLSAFGLAGLLFGLSAAQGAYKGIEQAEEQQAEMVAEERAAEQKAIQELTASNVPYIEHFKEFAPKIGWEWETLAAIGYSESHFNPLAESHVGALGLMQLMPATAEQYGLNDSTVFEARDNIEACTKLLASLQRSFRFVPDSAERTRFVLAAYNAGVAHILDARALARKYDANPNHWEDVAFYLTLLKEPEYYEDEVVKYGTFKGVETSRYVGTVERVRDKIKEGRLKW